MNIKFDIRLTKSQQEAYDLFHNDKYKHYVLNWSRQSGKSTLMKLMCIEWLLQNQITIGYICRNYLLAKKFFKELNQIIPNQLIRASNGTDLIIESVFGSTLQFFSAESGSSLRGQTFNYLILDEFAFFKFELTDGSHLWFDVLFPTIKNRGRKVVFVSTPLGKNNLFYEFYQRTLDKVNHHKWVGLTKTIYDDGLVSKEEIDEIKKSIPLQSFQQEFECEFLDGGNTFFQGFEKCLKDFSYQSKTKHWIGVDLSGDGKDSTIVTFINEVGQVNQVEINGTLDDKYKHIASLINACNHLQGAYIEINGLGNPMFNEIKKLVKEKSKLHEWQTTNSSKERIISNLAVAIANEELEYNQMELYNELSNFTSSYSKSGKLILGGNGNKHDDRVMSLAIALEAKNKLKSFSSSNVKFIDNSIQSYNLI